MFNKIITALDSVEAFNQIFYKTKYTVGFWRVDCIPEVSECTYCGNWGYLMLSEHWNKDVITESPDKSTTCTSDDEMKYYQTQLLLLKCSWDFSSRHIPFK